jgi:hypothetical protein
MQMLWMLGLLFVVVLGVLAWLVAYKQARQRMEARTKEAMDLFLEDLGEVRSARTRTQLEFIDDTAPAVLSVPPELGHPEWERPKRPQAKRWLH